MTFAFLIRDGIETDIPVCLALEASYETDYVWQMALQPESGHRNVIFRTERLPRPMNVEYPVSERRMRLSLSRKHCFLVVVGKDEPEMLGYLTMRSNPVHQIALVQDIVVGRSYRRHRIGTRLMNIARRWALEHDLVQLLVETQTKNYPGIQFLQKQGFAFCGFNDQYFRNGDIAVFFGQTLR